MSQVAAFSSAPTGHHPGETDLRAANGTVVNKAWGTSVGAVVGAFPPVGSVAGAVAGGAHRAGPGVGQWAGGGEPGGARVRFPDWVACGQLPGTFA